MPTREDYLRALEERSPRIGAEIEVLRTATPEELARLRERNPTLDLSIAQQDPSENTEE